MNMEFMGIVDNRRANEVHSDCIMMRFEKVINKVIQPNPAPGIKIAFQKIPCSVLKALDENNITIAKNAFDYYEETISLTDAGRVPEISKASNEAISEIEAIITENKRRSNIENVSEQQFLSNLGEELTPILESNDLSANDYGQLFELKEMILDRMKYNYHLKVKENQMPERGSQ